jgi:thiol-disulfide isomerase/thioredoxin
MLARHFLSRAAFTATLAALGASCAPVPAVSPEDTALPSPSEPLDLSDGTKLTLPAQRGKVVVLGFYAVWCPVSRKMLRSLGAVATPERRRRGLVVVPVDEEDARPDAERFARAAGLSGAIGLDAEGSFTRAMKLDTVPALVVVGRDGIVRRTHPGYHGEDDLATLARAVDALLAAPKDGALPSVEANDDGARDAMVADAGAPPRAPDASKP